MEGPKPCAPPSEYENVPDYHAPNYENANAPPIVEFRKSTSILSRCATVCNIVLVAYLIVSICLLWCTVGFLTFEMCQAVITPLDQKTCVSLRGATWMGIPIDEQPWGEAQYLLHVLFDEYRQMGGGHVCKSLVKSLKP